jgi:hypothetical protein
MYIRLHNSCAYFVFETYFEIRSDIFDVVFKFKGVNSNFSNFLLGELEKGVEEHNVVEYLSLDYPLEKNKIKKIITFLISKKLLIKRIDRFSKEPHDTLYDRQIRFFDSFENEQHNGESFNNRLQQRKVVIVGLGAYGSWLALHCARMGIRQIIGIDFDTVELSNLPRQVLYTINDIGISKAVACSKALTTVDPSIEFKGFIQKIENAHDLVPYLKDADLVFNAFGYYPKHEAQNLISGFIADASIKTQTPMLCLSTNWLGPFYIPKSTACYYCAVQQSEIEALVGKSRKNFRIEKRAFCPILAMTCSLAASEASIFLSGINLPNSINSILSLDPFNMEKNKRIPIQKLSCCDCHQIISDPLLLASNVYEN